MLLGTDYLDLSMFFAEPCVIEQGDIQGTFRSDMKKGSGHACTRPSCFSQHKNEMPKTLAFFLL